MRTWTAKLDGRDLTATSETLAELRCVYVSDCELASRVSELLLFDMHVLDTAYGVSPTDIMRSVENLEAGEPHNGIKPATEFKHAPLKGLWHKHYFSARFLPNNITRGLGSNGLRYLFEETWAAAESSVVTKEMIAEVAHRIGNEPISKRRHQGKLTGEWLVFAKHDGKNYYLCLGTHGVGNDFIYNRIMEHCVKDFPELPNWL